MNENAQTTGDAEMRSAARPGRWIGAVYIASIFVSAFLMFVVQPLVGRMLLPRYGGTPAVWNTALVFFQTVLLIGYAYAHGTIKWLGVGRQLRLHVLIVLLPLIVLPLRLLGISDSELTMWPMARVLWVLLLTVGLPFLALSANSTLVQRWFADSRLKGSGEPYRLYAASNVGSVLGLLAYPFLLEPLIGVRSQAVWWTVGYGLFVLLSVALIARTWRTVGTGGKDRGPVADSAEPTTEEPTASPEERLDPRPLTWRRRAGWAIRAGVAVSLLMSTTTQITTEVAPVPMLWVLPLLVYLLTFIIAFGWPDGIRRRPLAIVVAAAITVAVCLLLLPTTLPSLILGIGVMMLTLGASALLCHVDIARDRPGVASLTEFYLWISLGGALGGILNSLVAPVVFNWIAEYPITLLAVAVLMMLPPGSSIALWGLGARKSLSRSLSWLVPLLMVVATVWAAYTFREGGERWMLALFVPFYVLVVGLVLSPIGARRDVPGLRWSFPVAVLLATGFAAAVYTFPEQLVEQDRSFFGVRRVIDTSTRRVMEHGSTAHGAQWLDPEKQDVPLMYFHPSTPIGRIMDAQEPGTPIGVVGLGTGAMVALGKEDQHVVYYEIDPLSDRMAREHFTYLADTVSDVDVVLGDGRLVLERESDDAYDLLFLDAFNSDSVPTHLLTEEAVRLYIDKVSPGGLIVFNISNRYLDLKPVLAGVAGAVGAASAVAEHDPTNDERAAGAGRTEVVAVSTDPGQIEALVSDGTGWRHLEDDAAVVWTDDHVNLLPTFKR